MKLIQKYSFSILLPIFGIRGANWSSEKCKEKYFNVSGTKLRNSLSRRRELGLFSPLSSIFHPSLPKIGHTHPVKNYVFE